MSEFDYRGNDKAWLQLFCAVLASGALYAPDAALTTDSALDEFRKRFPLPDLSARANKETP